MRLIDADALKTKKVRSKERHEWVVPVAEIDWMPTIEERKTGKWIIYTVSMLDGEDCKCPECGQTSCAPYWHFCPNCGLKMEGAEPEDIPMEYFESGGR